MQTEVPCARLFCSPCRATITRNDGGTSLGNTVLSTQDKEGANRMITKTIRNWHSGKCIDVGGWSQQNGARLIQWDCHGGSNQKFSY